MKVKFNDPSEFLLELAKDQPADKLLRITRRYINSGMSPSINYLQVVATYINDRDQLVELTTYVGEDWGKEFACSREAHTRADKIIASLKQGAESLGIEVRAGALEEDE